MDPFREALGKRLAGFQISRASNGDKTVSMDGLAVAQTADLFFPVQMIKRMLPTGEDPQNILKLNIAARSSAERCLELVYTLIQRVVAQNPSIVLIPEHQKHLDFVSKVLAWFKNGQNKFDENC